MLNILRPDGSAFDTQSPDWLAAVEQLAPETAMEQLNEAIDAYVAERAPDLTVDEAKKQARFVRQAFLARIVPEHPQYQKFFHGGPRLRRRSDDARGGARAGTGPKAKSTIVRVGEQFKEGWQVVEANRRVIVLRDEDGLTLTLTR